MFDNGSDASQVGNPTGHAGLVVLARSVARHTAQNALTSHNAASAGYRRFAVEAVTCSRQLAA
jgi:hypothetical protein